MVPPLAHDSSSVPETVAAWRRGVLDRVFVSVFWAALFVFIVDVREALLTDEWRFVPSASIAVLGTGALAFGTRWPWRLRAIAFVLILLLSCGLTLANSAFLAPNMFVVGGMASVLIALSVGHRAAYATLLGFVLLIVASAVAFTYGETTPEASSFDARLPSNWLRVGSIFAVSTAIVIASVSFLTSKLTGAIQQSADLLDALRQENATRVASLKNQRQLEEKLRKSQQLEALGRLTGGVAHDFNNLLVVIIGHAEMLRNTLPVSRHSDLLAIEQAGERAAALIRQLLKFGKRSLDDQDVSDIDSTLSSSLALIERLLPSSIHLQFTPGSQSSCVRGSRTDLEQLVLNLCVNARDSMSSGGELVVSTDRLTRSAPQASIDSESEFICLTVSDTGCGIPEDVRDKLFEPFFTTKPADTGSGLGLSVVQRIVKSKGGFIEVSSRVDKGTQFRVYLPTQATPDPVDNESKLLPSVGGNETILVVDDIETVRTVTAQVLQSAGYRTLVCRDGEAALRCYESNVHSIALVLTDVIMPTMTGKALFDRLHAQAPLLPFLFCTGYSSNVLPEELFESPLCDLQPKPFQAQELLRKVRKLLDSKDALPAASS